MPILDRNLKPGTVLVARYKGQEHRAEVVKTKEGLRYKLKDGREFGSPASAGADAATLSRATDRSDSSVTRPSRRLRVFLDDMRVSFRWEWRKPHG